LAFVAAVVATGSSAVASTTSTPMEHVESEPAVESLKPTGVMLIRLLAHDLSPESLAGVGADDAGRRAMAWARAVEASGADPVAALGELLPPTAWFQARIIGKRDEPDLRSDARIASAYGRAYADILAVLDQAREAAPALEAAIETIWHDSGAGSDSPHDLSPVLARSDRWIPGRSALKYSHQYALDVFFTSVKRHGAAETGPAINSISSGIVVSTADDWDGGDKPSLYRSGGLSPNAGNGVIVYDPERRRYYVYLHLKSVVVRVGQMVASGQSLGLGGNTGVNARKKNHGTHVHIEIHDAEKGAWSSYRIRDLLLSIQ
jgi:murein DD-endopeptidase MepM/ murein hydrolase activator NlpD